MPNGVVTLKDRALCSVLPDRCQLFAHAQRLPPPPRASTAVAPRLASPGEGRRRELLAGERRQGSLRPRRQADPSRPSRRAPQRQQTGRREAGPVGPRAGGGHPADLPRVRRRRTWGITVVPEALRLDLQVRRIPALLGVQPRTGNSTCLMVAGARYTPVQKSLEPPERFVVRGVGLRPAA